MISLCLTNYNRYDMLLEAIQGVISDERITEIVISDDCSDEIIYDKLKILAYAYPKIKLHRNYKRMGMSLNKATAVALASNEYCILLDSDNIIGKDYIDEVYKKSWFADVIYCPELAKPTFIYTDYTQKILDKDSVKPFLKDVMFGCLLNTCNYFFHRDTYLDVYEYDPDLMASDTIYFNYLWLRSGRKMVVVPNLSYFHRMHTGSGWQQDWEANNIRFNKTLKLIEEL